MLGAAWPEWQLLFARNDDGCEARMFGLLWRFCGRFRRWRGS
jgi:hypothetical protein